MKPFKMRKPPVRALKCISISRAFKDLKSFRDYLMEISGNLYESTGSLHFGNNKIVGHYYDQSSYNKEIEEYRKWCHENKENIAKYKADADKRKEEKEKIKQQKKAEKLKKRLSDINEQLNKLIPQKPKSTGKLRDLDI